MDSPAPEYTLTVQDAARLCLQEQAPCAPRTISKHCELGNLEYRKEPILHGWKYLITEASVRNLIGDIKKDLHRQVQASIGTHEHAQASTGELEQLKAENMRLTIEGKVKDEMIDRTMQKVFEVGKQMNELENKLKQISNQSSV